MLPEPSKERRASSQPVSEVCAHSARINSEFSRIAKDYAQSMPLNDLGALSLLATMAEVVQGDVVLDVGCGPGVVSCHLARTATAVMGVDLTAAMLRQARIHQRQAGCLNVSWTRADVTRLPFRDERFSLVVSRYALHHLLEPESALHEMLRVNERTGRVAIVDVVLPDTAEGQAFNTAERLRDPSHVRALTLDELRALLTRAGLSIDASADYWVEYDLEHLLEGSSASEPDKQRILELLEVGNSSFLKSLERRRLVRYPVSLLVSRRARGSVRRHSKGAPSMRVRTLDGGEVELKPEALSGLKARHRGPLLLPEDVGYEESRTVWNAMIDRRPALIARCHGTADVLAAAQFALERDLLLCIKGGGHNIAGLATADGALMLDLSLLRGVWVDRQRMVARAQAGSLLGDVDRETQLDGLASVLGFVSLTGIAGLTLGGGFGYLTRRWGWTSDNVVGMEVVTADGRRVRASDDENPDLFWGLRGGGGNFGVVTSIDYALYPVGPEVVGGLVAWPASEAPGVLELYRKLASEAPPELTLVAILRPAPPAPWLPREIHGKPIVALLACHSGRLEDGEKAVAPIKAFGKPVGDVMVRRPYAQTQSLLDATQPKGRRYYWKSEYLPRLEEELCDKVIDHAARIRSPHSAVIIFQIEGALNLLENEHSPVGNRDARYVLNIAGAWEEANQDTTNIEWARGAWNDMRRFSTGGTYVNFLTQDEGPERIEAALGKGLRRLAEVKARWDPRNFFRTNCNIKPV